MINTLVVQDSEHKREVSRIAMEHKDWDVVETDNYEDALSKIQTGKVDVLAVAAELSANDCMDLVSKLRSEKPEANVYILMDNDCKCDRSKTLDRGFIYM